MSNYLVPGQLPAPLSIRSLQLHRQGNVNSPPVLELGSGQKLVLSFDELTNLAGQFRITFTHHNQNWEKSNIPEQVYLKGINELTVSGGTPNASYEPDYIHYEFTFPNRNMSFETSGNYMLHVSDFASGIKLFSLPFFVTESTGELETRIETVYNVGPRNAPIHQPFSIFSYPDFVKYPEFDLTFYFVQNRFWAKTRKSKQFDFIDKGKAHFHLSRDNSYAANYDFNRLNLSSLSMNGRQIIGWQPGYTPPRVILREDVLNFESDPVPRSRSNFGTPENHRRARYASVNFRFEDGGQFNKTTEIYLVGDFNQWLASEESKLEYNSDSGFWETTALIKEGTYSYKYALKGSGMEIDDLTLSDTITNRPQEYIAFVYFLDPVYKYQRLLQAKVFYGD